jgi:hypothetical protein
MEANAEPMRDLKQLAQLLRRRFARTSGRTFVMLAARVPRRPACNTDAITQPIPLLRMR